MTLCIKQFKVREIASYFLAKESMPPMKLLNLLYYAQGWHLGLTGKTIFKAPIEAGRYGPTIRIIYDEFKKFGMHPIEDPSPCIPVLGKSQKAILDFVYDRYKRYSGPELSSLTHRPGTPWAATWDGPETHGTDIPLDQIQSYFAKIIKSAYGEGERKKNHFKA